MEQTGFIWVDWILAGLIVLSGIVGLWRGFFRECLSVIVWVLAVIVAWLFADPVARAFEDIIPSYAFRFTLSAIILAIVVLIVGALVSMLISKLISATGLSGSDRLLGVVFGLIRGVVVATIIVGILVYMPLHSSSWWQRSVLIPKFEQLSVWSKDVVVNKIGPLLRSDMPHSMEKIEEHTTE